MKKILVVLNEQHKLLPEQVELLHQAGKYEIVPIPATGWTLDQMEAEHKKLMGNVVVFASPVPVLLAKLSYSSGYACDEHCRNLNGPLEGVGTRVGVLHNDRREKKELPNGKIIQTVAQTGWRLVWI